MLSLLPFFNFGKLFLDISTLTTGRPSAITGTFSPGPGFPFAIAYEAVNQTLLPIYNDGQIPNPPVPIQSVYWLFFDIFLFSLLTWYFDAVVPNEYGASRGLLFFLESSYWKGASHKVNAQTWIKSVGGTPNIQPGTEPAVVHEVLKTLNHGNPCQLKIVHVRKEYKNKISLKDMCLSLRNGELFALLGQNGAGKSTLMNILSGLTPATSGDVLNNGYSVKDQMHVIKKFMGVCPQHNILAEDFTAREYLRLFAGLKGILDGELEKVIEERLDAVRLLSVADNQISTYSGGMKRRLSVVLSTIGDPLVCYMDEPTTGMDPINRRHVWKFIESFKKDRIVILTTHSMEEAEVVS